MIDKSLITGVILAGGRGQRMDSQDKGLVSLAGRPMVEYVLDALAPQVGTVLINANRNADIYAAYGYPVVPDLLGGFHGPLAGMAAAMRAANTPYIATVSCDSPFIPAGLIERLAQALETDGAELSVAHSGERLEPVFALLNCKLMNSLNNYLGSGERKIDRWYATHKMAAVDFSDLPDTFLNINTPSDLAVAMTRLLRN
jgi:molybdopterin-guanine dinucleotide biosynthesis protein A